MTLTEFLLARIAEDEDEARHARPHSGGLAFANDVHGRLLIDPARVLAECEAHRLMIEACTWGQEVLHRTGVPGRYDRVIVRQPYGIDAEDDVLKPLASVYADHPDFREEWKS